MRALAPGGKRIAVPVVSVRTWRLLVTGLGDPYHH